MLPELVTPVPGPISRELGDRLARVECRTSTCIEADWPIFWERAEAANVWDADGNRFLDLTSAFGVAGLGHGATAAAARTQSTSLVHAMGDVHPASLKVRLCEMLTDATFGRWTNHSDRPAKVLLGNSGFEAVEAALKTAVLATGRNRIASFQGGYHGLGYGAMLGIGIPWFRESFEGQLAQITDLLPYPRENHEASIEAFRVSLDGLTKSPPAAILAEPIQGRGGIVVPHSSFLAELRRWCDLHGSLLILDEIYTGFHRSGTMFACEHEDIVPDLICLGKALSGGLPISACVGPAAIMDAWPPSSGEALHTSTFLGNPLACAMAIHSLTVHSAPGFAEKLATHSEIWRTHLAPLESLPGVGQICGRGLMFGIPFTTQRGGPDGDRVIAIVKELLRCGYIVLPDGPDGDVLALTPPFVLTHQEIAAACTNIGEIAARIGPSADRE